MLSSFLSTFLYVFKLFVTVVNPIGAAMFFLTITSGATRAQRMTLSNKVCIYFLIMALVTLCAGSFVLSFFGISLGVLRVAGGLILFSAGWLALNNTSSSSEGEEEVESTAGAHKPRTDQDWMKLAFYPFTMPLTLGPGAIAVTTAIGTSMNFTIPNVIGAFAAALANALIVWLCFRYADRITEILGPSGSDAIGRIFSFILVCLGVQIFWTGFSELWLTLVSSVPK